MTKKIGLTGGIGSGKSTIASFFNEFGIPVYIADDAAKRLMQTKRVIELVKMTFGDVVFENEVLNRAKLAEIVFNDVNKLSILNGIIHPVVKQDFDDWIITKKKYPYVVYEAAILFESGGYKECDVIITVIAPKEIRISRVVKRDNITREQVLDRMKMQWNDNDRLSKSDFIINNESLKIAKEEVLKILKILNIKQNSP